MTSLQMLSFYSPLSHLRWVPRVPNTRAGAEGRAGGHNHPLTQVSFLSLESRSGPTEASSTLSQDSLQSDRRV